MKNPFKKKEEKITTTKYVVYFNRPKEMLDETGYFLHNSWHATEFGSLHNAREFAEGQAKYFDCYVAEITPLFKYSNSTTEEAL
jgi:hypothetical protein